MHLASRVIELFDPKIKRTFNRRRRESQENIEIFIKEIFIEIPMPEEQANNQATNHQIIK